MRPLVIVTAALAAFGWSLGHGFHFDDYSLFTDPAITSPGGWAATFRLITTRPLTELSFWANYQLFGAAPASYHAVSLLLHALVSLLLWDVLKRLLCANAAFAGALVFAVHPLASEPVAYVYARGTLLATLFCLLSLRAFLKGREVRAVALFAAALLAKEECVMFPLVLALVAYWQGQKLPNLRPLAAMLILALAAGLRVLYATSVLPHSGAGFHAGITPLGYASVQGYALLRYLALLLIPGGFSVDPQITPSSVIAAGSWFAVAALAALAIWRFRSGVWLLCGLVLLLPSSSIFPASDLAADRRMYLPMIAFAALAGVLFGKLRPLWIAPLIAVLIGISITRMQVWSAERLLWTEAVERAPLKPRPLLQLARASDPGEAQKLLRRAVELAPRDPAIATEAGRLYLESGQPALALREFGRALSLAPGDAHTLNNRGTALEALGQSDAARQDFRRALEINPCLEEARQNLKLPPCPTGR